MHALAFWKRGLCNIAVMVCLPKPHEKELFGERET